MAISAQELAFIIRLQDSMSAELKPIIEQLQRTSQAAVDTRDSLRNIEAQGAGLGNIATKSHEAAAGMGSLKAAAFEVVAAFAALKAGNEAISATLGNFSKFEQITLGVEKYTSMGGLDLKVFNKEFRDLASAMPVPVEELGKMAQLASSIGVGSKDIIKFTDAVAQLKVTSNITGDELVKMTAQLLNLTGSSYGDAQKLVSTFAVLDNMTSNTAANVTAIARRVAQDSSAYNKTAAEVVALAASFANYGITAERAGSSTQRVLNSLNEVIMGFGRGAKAAHDFSIVMGAPAASFKEAFEKDAFKVMQEFLNKMGSMSKSSKEYNMMMQELNLTQLQTNSAMGVLIKHTEILNRNFAAADVAWADPIQRSMVELKILMEGLEQKVILLANNFKIAGASIGGVMSGPAKHGVEALTAAVQAIDKWFTHLSPEVQTAIAGFVTFGVTALGIVVTITSLVSVLRILGPLMLGPWGIAATAVVALGAAFLAYNGYLTPAVTLTKQENEILKNLAGSAEEAAKQMEKLNNEQRAQMNLVAQQKIRQDQEAYEKAQIALDNYVNSIKYAGVTYNEYGIALDVGRGKMSALQKNLEDLLIEYSEHKISLADLKRLTDLYIARAPAMDDATIKMADNIRNMTGTITNLVASLKSARDGLYALTNAAANLKDPTAPKTDGGKPTNTISGLTGPAKTGGAGKAESLSAFLAETELKIAGLGRETAAANESLAALTKMQIAEQDKQGALAIEDRGKKLGLAADKAAELASKYLAAKTAYDAAVNNAKLKEELQLLDLHEKKMQDETDAANLGTEAYTRYKKAQKFETDWDAIAKKLTALGIEKDALEKAREGWLKYEEALSIALDMKGKDLNSGIRDGLIEIGKTAADTGSLIKTALTGAFKGAEDAFVKFATTGTVDFSAMVKSIEEDLVRLAFKLVVEQPLFQMLGLLPAGTQSPLFGSMGGNGGGGGGGAIGSVGGLFDKIGHWFTGNSGNNNGGGSGDSSGGAEGIGGFFGKVGNWLSGDGWGNGGGGGVGGLIDTGSWDNLGSGVSGFVDNLTSFFHGGGVVGVDPPAFMQALSNVSFTNAPRYHSGLGNDEFKAILQKGERVITPQQNDRLMDKLKTKTEGTQAPETVHNHYWNITADADSFMRSKEQIMSMTSTAMSRTSSRMRAPRA